MGIMMMTLQGHVSAGDAAWIIVPGCVAFLYHRHSYDSIARLFTDHSTIPTCLMQLALKMAKRQKQKQKQKTTSTSRQSLEMASDSISPEEAYLI